MRVAITVFGSTISPLFDAARLLLLAEIERGEVRRLDEEAIGDLGVDARLSLLTTRGVQLLICGAISSFFHQALLERGIKVYPWVTGEVEDVLAFLAARYRDNQRALPARAAVTVTDRQGACCTASIFGCSHVAVLDADGRTVKTIDARSSADADRGCSRLARELIEAGVRVILTSACGPNAIGVLSAAGIRVISGVEGSLEEAAARLQEANNNEENHR
jgi:predicted Fe-Mo cluster-binding NifX family protein